MGVGAADGLADGPSLVAAEIVEDDEVAGPECRDQKLLDPGLEAAAVARAVEDVWGAQSVGAQAGEEDPGIVGVRQWPWGAYPFRRRPFSDQPRIGAMLVLIQVSSTNTRLSGSSRRLSARQRVRFRATALRACSRANSVFFEAQTLALQKPPDRVPAHRNAFGRQKRPKPVDGQMRRLADQLENQIPVRRQQPRTVAADLARRHAPGLAIARHPARHTRNTDAETRRHRPNRLARQMGTDNTLAKIIGIGSRHSSWPPSPVDSLNHIPKTKGIPKIHSITDLL